MSHSKLAALKRRMPALQAQYEYGYMRGLKDGLAQAAEEIAFLERFADAPDMTTGNTTRDEMRKANRQLLAHGKDIYARLIASERDAERYRWLRSANTWLTGGMCDGRFLLREERLDAAIDKAWLESRKRKA